MFNTYKSIGKKVGVIKSINTKSDPGPRSKKNLKELKVNLL